MRTNGLRRASLWPSMAKTARRHRKYGVNHPLELGGEFGGVSVARDTTRAAGARDDTLSDTESLVSGRNPCKIWNNERCQKGSGDFRKFLCIRGLRPLFADGMRADTVAS